MSGSRRAWRYVLALVLVALAAGAREARAATVQAPDGASPRVRYGAQRLTDAVAALPSRIIRLAINDPALGREAFRIASQPDGSITITGGDDSGVLYGCLELANRARSAKQLPHEIHFTDKPVMVLRGPCIGMQKTSLLPGRKVYEYPYTPESFPFFYDKQHWAEYLDFLAENRMNTLYLWNGHPFASLVRLEDYPYAVEVPDEVFEKNVEMLRYITAEADKRGIWLVQMFYSLFVSKPFAEKHGIETQLHKSTPLVDDYMRKSIAAFVKEYPNVGLLICLGEALQGAEEQTRHLTESLLPGVKDGMKAAGLTEEPPVVIRAHASDPKVFMPEALKHYRNLYTMAKYNGESLTTWEPRGVRQDVHLTMSRLGSSHVANVHILANLEPFRYGATRFIQKCVAASRDRLGAKGIHLYPLFYWDWPISPDKTQEPLKQWERDWIWFEAWARYSWNPDRNPEAERAYWVDRLAEMYGTTGAAEKIFEAYNDAGECAPRILRRFGITEGNRQTMSLGMTLDQLVDPERYRPFPELWESQSPPGERLQEYVEREWNKQPHEGETPPQIVAEVLEFSRQAVDAIDAAAPHVTKNRDEFARLRNDVHCIRAMTQNYAAKVNAALHVLRYHYSKDPADLEKAESYLDESLQHYRTLASLTRDTYKFANSMQTSQRKIPFVGGVDGKPANYHWTQLVPAYEKELADFSAKVAQIKQGGSLMPDESALKPLPRATITLIGTGDAELYELKPGERVWTDRKYMIESIAPELVGLTGVRFSHEAAKNRQHTPIEFEVSEPVRILIGYFKDPRAMWLKVPDLETDARADERGGVEPLILNAVSITESPAVDVHALSFPAGKHTLDVKGKGSFVVLGVIPKGAKIEKRDAQRKGGS
ncbi:MAG TPA: hypothetical protein VGR35_02495 [Tepidisphaeraceae bacterium]|nr:hypothetical protein [Tepidisphaeraceae bacterium]